MTSPLDNYKEWVGSSEAPKREIIKARAQARLLRKHPASLSYKTVLINGVEQLVSIVDTTDLPKKKIFSMPGESLIHGGLVDWEESKWLITEINAHNELYNEGRLERCNHLLKWKDDYGYLQERWCIIEDGTKYLIGEKDGSIDHNTVMTIGDARLALTIAKDDATRKFRRGTRFIIDDVDADEALAYEITKSNRLFNLYDDVGVYRFILNEVVITDDDNMDIRVADYESRGYKEDQIVDPDYIKETGVYL